MGVLFDTCAAEAERVGEALACQGLRIRYNQPYSGLDGLIFSARTHGEKHGLRYIELELNNLLLRTPAAIETAAQHVIRALAPVIAP